jgi:hypothetical protein
LRPLSVGEILDAGIKVFTRHWKPLAGTVAILTGPIFVVYVLLIASIDDELLSLSASFSTSTSTSEDPTATELVGFGLSYLVLFIAFLLAFVACFKAVSDAWLGAEPSISRSLRFAVRNLFKSAMLGLVAGIVVAIGFAACLLPGIWIGIAWCLCFPAMLFERIGPFAALRRSFSLTKDRWWASFLLWIVGYLLVSIIGGVIQLGLEGIAQAAAGDNVVARAVSSAVGSIVSSAITYPFLAAVLTILYFDQRVRKEGFDLQLQAEGFGIARDPDAPLPAPLIGDDLYTPEQRAAAPYWPPPPGWTPPPAGPPPPSQWASSSGWSAPSADEPPVREPEWDGQSYPTRSSGDPLRPEEAPPPTDPLPPADDAAPSYQSWWDKRRDDDDDPPPSYPPRPDPPPKDPEDDDEGDKGRAGWLPPEAPRGPGGL